MLNISNLSVSYPDKTKAVDQLTISVRAGESIALAGANGAGKTSLMLALVGILPAEGAVEVDGIALRKDTLREIRSRVGLVFQNPDDQLFMANVYDDIAFGPRNLGLSEEETQSRVDGALALLGAERLRDRSSLKLSGGEKRVAAIATVLAMEPAIMLFDEPTAFLDMKARRTLIRLIQELPHTKLIASHDLPFLLETCDRAVLMKNGSLFADGSPEKLFRDHQLMQSCDLEGEG